MNDRPSKLHALPTLARGLLRPINHLSRSIERRPKRVIALLLAATVLTTLFGFAAQAGQGPSQWCSDGGGMEVHIINSPATFNVEAGGPVGPANNGWIVCASPTPWGDATPAPTGGAAWFGTTQGTTGGNNWVGCGSDNNSTALQFGCNDQVGTNLSNPLSPSASVTYSNTVIVPGVASAQTGCSYGYTAGTGGVGCVPGGPATRPSEWCSDNQNSSEVHILNWPATFNLEPGSSLGNPNYFMTCYSTTPYGSGDTEATGGSVSVNTPTQNGTSMGCWSDTAAIARLDCGNGIGLNTSNPTDPRANTALYGNGLNVAGNQVNAPSVGAGTDCNSGTVAVSVYSCANGGLIGISGTGDASGGTLAASGTGCTGGNAPDAGVAISGTNCAYGALAGVSGTGSTGGRIAASGAGCSWGWYVGVNAQGCAYSTLLAVSATGPATAYGNSSDLVVAGVVIPNGFGVSGTNSGYGWLVGVSGTGYASGVNAVSGTGNSYANTYQVYPSVYLGNSVSGTGSADGVVAVSGNGCSTGWYVGASAQGCAYSTLLAVSGTGPATAYGNSTNLVLPNGYVVPNGFGISGTNTAYGWLVGVSGTGYANGVNAVSGTGNATANGYEYYPGVSMGAAASGTGTAASRDIAISPAGTARNADGSHSASLINVSGGSGETWVADNMVMFHSGVLTHPENADQALDVAYKPPPVDMALKEAGLAAITPYVLYNMATGLVEQGPGLGTSSAPSFNNPNSAPDCAEPCPPVSKTLGDTLGGGQHWVNTCVPASTAAVLAAIGWNPGEQSLAAPLHTNANGTAFNAAASVMNMRDQNGNRVYQNRDTFYTKVPRDAGDYMSMASYAIGNRGHPMINGVNPVALWWFAGKNGFSTGAGHHADITFGYDQKANTVTVGEVWNPLNLGWNQQQVNTYYVHGNPYGGRAGVKIAYIYSAVMSKTDDGTITGGIVW